ncbi:MAG: antibiotic biosynthesis monooxygenase [Bacteroidota bacterium]|nr:antibiotic biosynthesis monooxygenase [Bacteroidota bacterium]MDX5404192.1 antibiotic biosynthesis monooxygenase [Bacteroidota bacterium]
MIRIVKMTFEPERVQDFLTIFEASKEKIRAREGCKHLELWQDQKHENVFFTYSIWEGPEFLEMYRQSELFTNVWRDTKALFAEKAKAWSVEKKIVVE